VEVRARPCASCGTQLSPSLLSCPVCHALVHADTLKRLAADAQAATDRGDTGYALQAWRRALELLPPDAPQFAIITRRVDELSRKVSFSAAPLSAAAPTPAGAPAKHGSTLKRAWAAIAAAVILALSKLKLLLLGLTKLGTLSSMLLFLGVYWALFGWKWALGFVVCIYIHEMGHVASLAKYGVKASAPMFIPGVGALVRLHQAPANVHEDARVGLAGPVWGTAAGLAAWAIYLWSGAPIWAAIAHTAGWLNLFNLLPVWQLDGGRGFRALTHTQRWMVVAMIVATWLVFREGMLLIVGIGAVWSAFQPAPAEEDRGAFGLYCALVIVLAGLISGTQVGQG
jgi:Zn-dependent protease